MAILVQQQIITDCTTKRNRTLVVYYGFWHGPELHLIPTITKCRVVLARFAP